jgi:hypothetical protein
MLPKYVDNLHTKVAKLSATFTGYLPPLLLRRYTWYSFLEVQIPQGHNVAGRINPLAY